MYVHVQKIPSRYLSITFALVKDLGWANVGLHSTSAFDVRTPNLDALAHDGIELRRTYAFMFCRLVLSEPPDIHSPRILRTNRLTRLFAVCGF